MKSITGNMDYFLFALVYFLEGVFGITAIAMPLFMREELGLGISSISIFSGMVALPWILKPLYGVLSDSFPILGYRRKSYMILSSLLVVLGWVLTANVTTVIFFVLAQLLVDTGIASLDVFVDGLAVQKSTKCNSGLIQSICWGSRSLGAVIGGFLGGYILSYITYRNLFLIMSFMPIFIILTVLTIQEKKSKSYTLAYQSTNIKKLLNKDFILVLCFLFAFFATPSFGVSLFFLLKSELNFSSTVLGMLNTFSSLGGIFGAILYAKYLDHYRMRSFLGKIIVINVFATLSYLVALDVRTAILIYFFNGFVGYITIIACMKLTSMNCPKSIEATTFAFVTSLINLGGSVVSPILGGWLITIVALPTLIVISALSNLVAYYVLQQIRFDG